jgi:hypothetical protein
MLGLKRQHSLSCYKNSAFGDRPQHQFSQLLKNISTSSLASSPIAEPDVNALAKRYIVAILWLPCCGDRLSRLQFK